ncbi:MAG: response regulator [Dissulfurispiraceae bacterium]|jgi:DNA-binding response OmpR family regulator|nr:response regulator [Dissulfurispiraceae bacterium]
MKKGKVVVIDDSPIARRLAMATLSEEGYKVYTAEDGEEGYKLAEEVIPNVVLVDFIMPRMNGYQFCKMMRDNEALKNIPIILVTAKGEDAGEQFRKKFGVCDYLIKPFEPSELIDKVNTIQTWNPSDMCEPDPASRPEEAYNETDDIHILPDDLTEDFAKIENEFPEIKPLDMDETVEIKPVEIEKAMDELNSFIQGSHYTADEQKPAAATESYSSPAEKTVEQIVQKVLQNELSMILKNSISTISVQPGVVSAPADAILSGELSNFNIFDIFQLVDSTQLTGSMTVNAAQSSYMIYFDQGKIVYAAASTDQGGLLFGDFIEKRIGISREVFSRVAETARAKSISLYKAFIEEGVLSRDDLLTLIRDKTDDAVCAILELDAGKFYFQKSALPADLKDIPIRLKPAQVILEGVKRVAKRKYLR